MNESKSDTPIRLLSRSERQSRASLHSKSSAISSCRICLTSIQRPAELACGHRFCEKCLQKYWSEGDKPEHIVCPLCRAGTSNINFDKRAPSVDDFRKMFTPTAVDIAITDSRNNTIMIMCLKISTIMTTLYYMLKWFQIPIMDLFMYFQMRFRNIL